MDYLKWSREYLDESERIRRRIAGLKEASVGADNETRENLLYRINLLYGMYLELRQVGKHLEACEGRKRTGRQKIES